MDNPSGEKKRRAGKVAGLIATAVIILLIIGYIPLSSLLMKGATVDYTISLRQYDKPKEVGVEPRTIDVVSLNGENSYLVSGLSLEKRYTEMYLDTRGTEARRLELAGEFLGDPDQLWLRVSGQIGPTYEKPLYLQGLEEDGWQAISSGDFTLYQKDGRFTDMDEFLRYAANTDELIGLAGCNSGEVMALGGAVESGPLQEQLSIPLRGPHVYEMIVEGDRLELEVAKRDLNRTKGGDDVSLKLYRGGELVFADQLEDDGNTSSDNVVAGEEQSRKIELQGLGRGMFRLEIGSTAMGNDYAVTSLKTNVPRATFVDAVHLFDPWELDPAKAGSFEDLRVYLYSPGGTLAASTYHPYRARSVEIDGKQAIKLEQTDQLVQIKGTVPVDKGLHELAFIEPASLDLEMTGGGFSFRPDTLFDPNLMNLQQLYTSAVKNYSLILTRGYTPPEVVDGRMVLREEVGLLEQGIVGSRIKVVLEKMGDNVLVSSLRMLLE
jgi:hypothetical protein